MIGSSIPLPAGFADIPISDIRRVVLHWQHSMSPTSHFVHKGHVKVFVEACKRLHHNPGVNPYNGVRTSHVLAIEVCKLSETLSDSYWWSHPSLDPKTGPGARIIEFSEMEGYESFPFEPKPEPEYCI